LDTDDLLLETFSAVERLGLPLAVTAWISVFSGVIGMAIVLRLDHPRDVWLPAVLVGATALTAHVLDFVVTLQMSPDLALEANPIWRIVIDAWGLPAAKLYGFTGKVMLALISFELFAYYLVQRERLFPQRAQGFSDFWRSFGASHSEPRLVRWPNLANFFAFSFSLLGPFFFYVAFLNSLVNDPRYLRFPSMVVALAAYMVILIASYFTVTYGEFRRRTAR
jgi:hypothetical protein